MVPGTREWLFFLESNPGRPAAARGITITPAQNSKGSWAEYVDGALVTSDCFGIEINFNSNSRSGAIGNTLVDIGIDPAAGTAYSVVIPDLSACHASPLNVASGGIWYYFPLFIPAGSSIAARASIDNATVGTLRSFIRLFGKPRHPEFVRCGRYVEAIGVVAATSEGTVVVPGGASEGTWTSLGTLSRDAWWYQLGVFSSDASLTAGTCEYDLSIGDATNKHVLPEPIVAASVTGTGEQFSFTNDYAGPMVAGVAGQTVYARGQHSGTPDTDITCIAYALGG